MEKTELSSNKSVQMQNMLFFITDFSIFIKALSDSINIDYINNPPFIV